MNSKCTVMNGFFFKIDTQRLKIIILSFPTYTDANVMLHSDTQLYTQTYMNFTDITGNYVQVHYNARATTCFLSFPIYRCQCYASLSYTAIHKLIWASMISLVAMYKRIVMQGLNVC